EIVLLSIQARLEVGAVFVYGDFIKLRQIRVEVRDVLGKAAYGVVSCFLIASIRCRKVGVNCLIPAWASPSTSSTLIQLIAAPSAELGTGDNEVFVVKRAMNL